MSEGERVVFEFTGDDRLVQKGEFYTDQRDARNGVMLANKEGRFIESFILRRIPDPVPALQSRISDYVDTVEAMLAAAGLDLSNHAEAEAEVSRFGTHPSDYIRAKFSEAQARIAELEAVLVAAKELPVLAVCQCQSQVQREVMDLGWKMVEIYRRIDAALKPPTPAAAKEQ